MQANAPQALNAYDSAPEPYNIRGESIGSQTINIPDVGAVRFPNTMSAEEIRSAAGRLWMRAQLEQGKIEGSAPVGLRMLVGKESDPTKRLALMAANFDTVIPVGQDNYIYKDKDGKLKVYNPEGLDWKDIPSLGRDVVWVGGDMLTQAGTLASTGNPIAAGVAGPVAGAAAAQAYDATIEEIAKANGYIVPQQDFVDRVKEFGVDTGLGLAGNIVFSGLNRAAKGAMRIDPARAKAFREDNVIPPSIGAISKSKGIAGFENALATIPGSVGRMHGVAEGGREALRSLLDKSAADIAGGSVKTPAGLGEMIFGAAAKSKGRFDRTKNMLYSLLNEKVGSKQIDISGTMRWIDDEAAKLGGESGAAFKKDMLALIDDIRPKIKPGQFVEYDALSGAMQPSGVKSDLPTLNAVLDSRNSLEAKAKEIATTSGIDMGKRKALYGQLTSDIERQLSGNELGYFQAADKFYAKQKPKQDYLDSVLIRDAGGQPKFEYTAYSASDPNMGIKQANTLYETLDPQTMRQIEAARVKQLSQPRPGSGFDVMGETSPATTTTQFNYLMAERPEVYERMFGDSLENARVIADSMNRQSKLYNTSGTAQSSNTAEEFRGLAGFLAGLPVGFRMPLSPFAIPLSRTMTSKGLLGAAMQARPGLFAQGGLVQGLSRLAMVPKTEEIKNKPAR